MLRGSLYLNGPCSRARGGWGPRLLQAQVFRQQMVLQMLCMLLVKQVYLPPK